MKIDTGVEKNLMTSTGLVPVFEEALVRVPVRVPVEVEEPITPEVVIEPDKYGKKIKNSRLCPICKDRSRMRVNLARARDHMTIEDISTRFGFPMEALEIHFKSHFQVSKENRRIIELREQESTEANEFVEVLLEGNLDFFCAVTAVLESKAKRINAFSNRIDFLTDYQEIDDLGAFETSELMQLNRELGKLETDALKAHELLFKKILPGGKEEMKNAVIAYKYSILSKMLDAIQVSLNEFESRPEYEDLIRNLRSMLASKFNKIEEEVLKSGGIVASIESGEEVDGEEE